MMIINDHSRVISKLETSLTDDARVIIYDRHMFIVQATGRGHFFASNLCASKFATNNFWCSDI
jgi:hypothetical protein